MAGQAAMEVRMPSGIVFGMGGRRINECSSFGSDHRARDKDNKELVCEKV